MAAVALDPMHAEGLPLQPKYLEPRKATGLELRAQEAAKPVFKNFGDELTTSKLFDPLYGSYQHSCNRLQDMVQDIRGHNFSLEELRRLKQMLRNVKEEIGKGHANLSDKPELKALLDLCIEKHGLIDPKAKELTADSIASLVHNVEDTSDTHNNYGDEMRLKFKQHSADAEAMLKMLVEILNIWNSMRKAVIESMRH